MTVYKDLQGREIRVNEPRNSLELRYLSYEVRVYLEQDRSHWLAWNETDHHYTYFSFTLVEDFRIFFPHEEVAAAGCYAEMPLNLQEYLSTLFTLVLDP